MLVAKVAQIDLMFRNSNAFYLAQNLTSILNKLSHGKITNFVESATWPDDIKSFSLNLMDNWHFLNIPIRLNDTDKPHIEHNPNNALAFMKTAMKTLTLWTKEEINELNGDFEKSMMLRYLIHVVGDIHQPLHAAEFFDNERFIKGDYGGNLFYINYTDRIGNLHKFFDSGADSLPNDFTRPLNESSMDLLTKISLGIMKEYPNKVLPDIGVQNNTDFETWILESANIAKDFIYKNIEYMGKISDDYKAKSFAIVKQRIAQGGFRLARLIEEIYDSFIKARLFPRSGTMKLSKHKKKED